MDLIRTTDLTAEQRAYIDVVEHGAGQILNLAEDLMDTQEGARDEAPTRFRSNPTLCHPRRDIIDLAWLSIKMQKRYSEKVQGLQMRLEVQELPPLPDAAMCDAARARQVLTNILGNAVRLEDGRLTGEGGSPLPPVPLSPVQRKRLVLGCARSLSAHKLTSLTPPAVPPAPVRSIQVKFTPAGGSVQCSVQWIEPESTVRVSVRDTGIGITPEGLSRIFSPFAQAEGSATKAAFGGNGLGLVLSRDICHALGGDLTLSSDGPGHGCLVVATFKMEPAQKRQPAGAPSAPRRSTSNGLHRVEYAVKRTSEAIVRAASQIHGIASSFRVGGTQVAPMGMFPTAAAPGAPLATAASGGRLFSSVSGAKLIPGQNSASSTNAAWTHGSRSSAATTVGRPSVGALQGGNRHSAGGNGGPPGPGGLSPARFSRSAGGAAAAAAAAATGIPYGDYAGDLSVKRGSADSTWELPSRVDHFGHEKGRRNTIQGEMERVNGSRSVAELQSSSSTVDMWEPMTLQAAHAATSGHGVASYLTSPPGMAQGGPQPPGVYPSVVSSRTPGVTMRERSSVTFAPSRRVSRDGSGPWPALDVQGSATVAAAAAAAGMHPSSSLASGAPTQRSAGLLGAVIAGIKEAMAGATHSAGSSGHGGGLMGAASAASGSTGGGVGGGAGPFHVAVPMPGGGGELHTAGSTDAEPSVHRAAQAAGLLPPAHSDGAAVLAQAQRAKAQQGANGGEAGAYFETTDSVSGELRIAPSGALELLENAPRRGSDVARARRRSIAVGEEGRAAAADDADGDRERDASERSGEPGVGAAAPAAPQGPRRLTYHKSMPRTRRERGSFDAVGEDDADDPGEGWVCTMRVVAAEDDMLCRKMLSLMLKQAGFLNVAMAENGRVASELVLEDPAGVALLVLDSNMGGGDLGEFSESGSAQQALFSAERPLPSEHPASPCRGSQFAPAPSSPPQTGSPRWSAYPASTARTA